MNMYNAIRTIFNKILKREYKDRGGIGNPNKKQRILIWKEIIKEDEEFRKQKSKDETK